MRDILIQAVTFELIAFIVANAAELGGDLSFDDLGTTVRDAAVGVGLSRTRSASVSVGTEFRSGSALYSVSVQ